MNILDRAKIATKSKTDLSLSEWLGVTQSVVAGYKKRETVPMEQCIKIAEKTGVSLDWLILGRGEQGGYVAPEIAPTEKLDSEKSMLLTGWDYLNREQRDIVFDLIRQLARGESVAQAVQHTINIHANVGQANAGNGNIENLIIPK